MTSQHNGTVSDHPANILLVDDHALFRDSLARFLDGVPGFKVMGGCATVDEAKEFLLANQVDLVLLDFALGDGNGFDFMNVVASIRYQGRVLLVTAGVNDASAAKLIRCGICGIFLKHCPPVTLVDAIRQVLARADGRRCVSYPNVITPPVNMRSESSIRQAG